jgi:hypothetical protein
LPGVEDGPLIPEGYGKAGVLFSKHTRFGTKVPHRTERGDSQGKIVVGLEARLLGYFSDVVSLEQLGHPLEGFK